MQGLTDDQIEYYQNVFYMFDTEGINKIPVDKLGTCLQMLSITETSD